MHAALQFFDIRNMNYSIYKPGGIFGKAHSKDLYDLLKANDATFVHAALTMGFTIITI